jgi:hypothetical protein
MYSALHSPRCVGVGRSTPGTQVSMGDSGLVHAGARSRPAGPPAPSASPAHGRTLRHAPARCLPYPLQRPQQRGGQAEACVMRHSPRVLALHSVAAGARPAHMAAQLGVQVRAERLVDVTPLHSPQHAQGPQVVAGVVVQHAAVPGKGHARVGCAWHHQQRALGTHGRTAGCGQQPAGDMQSVMATVVQARRRVCTGCGSPPSAPHSSSSAAHAGRMPVAPLACLPPPACHTRRDRPPAVSGLPSVCPPAGRLTCTNCSG